jgi:uncharacterized membrane protein YphA (DoxX/SURF4 family)
VPSTGAAAVEVSVVVLTLRLGVGLLFLRAGAQKLAAQADFRRAVRNYKIVPPQLVNATAATVPAVEVTAGGLLMLGAATSIAGWLLAALLAVFSAAIAINLSRGRVFDCGCGGGAAPRRISWRHVVSNLLLAACAVAVAVVPIPALALYTGPGGVFAPVVPPGSAVPVVLAAALAAVATVLLRAAAGLPGQLRAVSAVRKLADPGRPVHD